ncbi:MAG: hypothetical protein U0175_31550 [Caldilineaceae bacterium]
MTVLAHGKGRRQVLTPLDGCRIAGDGRHRHGNVQTSMSPSLSAGCSRPGATACPMRLKTSVNEETSYTAPLWMCSTSPRQRATPSLRSHHHLTRNEQ